MRRERQPLIFWGLQTTTPSSSSWRSRKQACSGGFGVRHEFRLECGPWRLRRDGVDVNGLIVSGLGTSAVIGRPAMRRPSEIAVSVGMDRTVGMDNGRRARVVVAEAAPPIPVPARTQALDRTNRRQVHPKPAMRFEPH
jgi:hypothetical protein